VGEVSWLDVMLMLNVVPVAVRELYTMYQQRVRHRDLRRLINTVGPGGRVVAYTPEGVVMVRVGSQTPAPPGECQDDGRGC
jgi:hypothetical protein